MPHTEERIRKRQEVALDEVKRHWKRDMKVKEAKEILYAHAHSMDVPDFYDCLKEDPDHLVDIMVGAANAARYDASMVDPVDSLCEPLTAASLRENEKLQGSSGCSIGENGRPDEKASLHGERLRKLPSYDDDDSSDMHNVVFLHSRLREWQNLRARYCREKESFISQEAVDRCHLAGFVRDVHGAPTVRICCQPPQDQSGKTFEVLFYILERGVLKTDAAIGKDAWKEVDTPPHSDSGVAMDLESAESIGSDRRDTHAGPLQYASYSPPGHVSSMMTQEKARALGAFSGAFYASYEQASFEAMNTRHHPRSRSKSRRGPNG